MAKKCLIVLLLALILSGTAGCICDPDTGSAGVLRGIIGESQDQIHRVLGEPSGVLSGLWGDIYSIENGTKIIIYYDQEGCAEHIKIMVKEGNDTAN